MTIKGQLRLPSSRPTVWLLLILFWNPNFSEAQDGEIVKIVASPDDDDTDLCRGDDSLAEMCYACAALPPMLSLPAEQCCGEEDAMVVCSECLTDPASCLLQVLTIENAISAALGAEKDGADTDQFDLSNDGDADMEGKDSPPDSDEVSVKDDAVAVLPVENSKRYGTLYLGKRPLHLSPRRTVLADVIKRNDMDDVMGPLDDADADADVSDLEKRWGTLGLGSNRYGRWYSGLHWTPANQVPALERNNGKRWGSLGIGKRWGSLGIGSGRRWSSLGVGKRWGFLGIGSGKRWGSLGIGKKWGTLGIGKRWGSLGIGKRWGSLGIGNRGSTGLSSRYWLGKGKRWGTLGLGKRADASSSDGDGPDVLGDVAKRWGSLGLGTGIRWGPSLRGKRWGSLGLSNWRKRWGHLGLSRGKRWGTLGIGKRSEVLTALDDNANYLDSVAEADDEDRKRWGTLGLGKRGDAFGPGAGDKPEPDMSEDKRWGTLSIGKRWGNLGGFGGFKRWGYIGLGGRNSFPRPRKLAKRSADEGAKGTAEDPEENGSERTAMTDAGEKKWGSLGIGKKWGSLGIGKKWGYLGIGKKWGSLGIGKKWGTLNFGKKWGSLGIGKKLSFGGADKIPRSSAVQHERVREQGV